jgi:hypothetical protein
LRIERGGLRRSFGYGQHVEGGALNFFATLARRERVGPENKSRQQHEKTVQDHAG